VSKLHFIFFIAMFTMSTAASTNAFCKTSETLNQALTPYDIELQAGNEFYVFKDSIYPVKDKTFHSIMAQNQETRIELEITKSISQSEATNHAKQKYILINSLYQPQVIPYTGKISHTAACQGENSPKQLFVKIAGFPTKAILVNAGERYTLGVCGDDLIKQVGVFAAWYNPSNKVLYQLTIFQPSPSFDQKKILLFLESIKNIGVKQNSAERF